MKKSFILFLSLFILSLCPVKADEGMWLLPLLQKLNGKQMSEMGFTITPSQIYDINHSSLKDAIVIFGGGCTGEIVSNNGLIFTNHHCGYSSIQKLSSVEHNYLKDGYWAMNQKEELPAKGLSVTFLESFTDVTKEVNKALEGVGFHQRDSVILALEEAYTDDYAKKNTADKKYLSAEITSFYGGNTYYFIVYKVYRDIRFVGAPPSSIGKFGADTDNWMWPRHTGDFSVFRVYADKDNNPAGYSEDNVPYRPKQFLTISLKGVKPQDPTMIMGYPGSTNRFMTRSELVETRDISNAIRIYVRGVRQEILMADMESDPKIMIQYASKYSGSSNGWKKWMGMNETFKKLGVEERMAAQEEQFTKWVNKGGRKRVEKYGKALAEIDTAIASRKDSYRLLIYLTESVRRIELVSASSFVRSIDNVKLAKDTADRRVLYSKLISSLQNYYKDYSLPTDRKVASAMMKIYQENIPADKQISIFKTIDSLYGGNMESYLDYLYGHSVFTDLNKVVAAIDDTTITSLKEDPAYILLSSCDDTMVGLLDVFYTSDPLFDHGKKDYIAGTLEMRKGEAIYPDANFTMRLTYGSVLPYSPRDAVFYDYYTTLDGVMEKEDPNNWEFVVPDRLKELWKNKDFGQYGLADGRMPVCFLSNNDITGGNSGSPIMNGAGELIGLAFDGNWEAMSGDIIFEPNLQRCINVDIRYVLFIIDKFGGAGYLLDEMRIVK